jgi:hypothetical protein
VSEQQDKQEIEDIALVNEELMRALRACHSIIDDYRSKLTLSLNEIEPANDDEDDSCLA